MVKSGVWTLFALLTLKLVRCIRSCRSGSKSSILHDTVRWEEVNELGDEYGVEEDDDDDAADDEEEEDEEVGDMDVNDVASTGSGAGLEVEVDEKVL